MEPPIVGQERNFRRLPISFWAANTNSTEVRPCTRLHTCDKSRWLCVSRRTVHATFFLAIPTLIAMKIFLGADLLPPTISSRLDQPGFFGIRAQSNAADEGRNSEHWTARDTDGDGTWDEFTTLQGTFTRPGLRTHPKRWLVCLDGVPVGEMQSMWDRGHFRILSPHCNRQHFSRDTETARTEAMHAVPVPGYEHIFFDRGTNESQSVNAERTLGMLEKYGLKCISPNSVARAAFRDGAI